MNIDDLASKIEHTNLKPEAMIDRRIPGTHYIIRN